MGAELPRGVDQLVGDGWVTFPGGELEGRRPKILCLECRERLNRTPSGPSSPSRHSRPLCFQCYRAELDRERALKAAGDLDTASAERFQSALPFEPVNRSRLEMLKAERAVARTTMAQGVGRFADKRRQAQINARHALQRIAARFTAQSVAQPGSVEADRTWASAVHAAELQLPESWLPFVVSR